MGLSTKYQLDNSKYQKVVETTMTDIDTNKSVVTNRKIVTIDKDREVARLTREIQELDDKKAVLQTRLDDLDKL